MSKLTVEQQIFIENLGILPHQVFDATNLTRQQYAKVMLENGYEVAYGVTPCQKANHTLRNRAGNCLQCFPLSSVYKKNHERSGYVYIAYSHITDLIKIGTTGNVNKRVKSLNEQLYGGTNDWTISLYKHIDKDCGDIEKRLHSALKKFHVISHYFKDGKEQATYEIFNYPLEKAFKLLKEIVATKDLPNSSKLIRRQHTNRPWNDGNRDDRLLIKHQFAEAWLAEASQLIQENYASKGFIVPKVRVLYGFTTNGYDNRKKTKHYLGECLSRAWTSDDTNIIVITPLSKRAIDVLSTLGHELIHAIDDCQHQHGSNFTKIAKSIGFGSLGEEIYLKDDLHDEFTLIEEKVGRFPFVALL